MRDRDVILQMKYARVISIIAEFKHISPEEAMDIFYKSKTFELICDERTDLFTMSDKYLAEEICREGVVQD